jgi:hypothetical protein
LAVTTTRRLPFSRLIWLGPSVCRNSAIRPSGTLPGTFSETPEGSVTGRFLSAAMSLRSSSGSRTTGGARKYGFVGCFRRGEQLLVATSSSFPKGAFQNDICRFESSHPSQPVRSLLMRFPAVRELPTFPARVPPERESYLMTSSVK